MVILLQPKVVAWREGHVSGRLQTERLVPGQADRPDTTTLRSFITALLVPWLNQNRLAYSSV